MTNKPKSMQEKKDEAAEKYCNFRLEKEDSCVWVADRQGFKAGWDARDKIENESLKIAVQALDRIHGTGGASFCMDDLERFKRVRNVATKALTKISELRGER